MYNYIVELDCEFKKPFNVDGTKVTGAICIRELQLLDSNDLIAGVGDIVGKISKKLLQSYRIIELKVTEFVGSEKSVTQTIYY
jgi:hypothetical protein